MPKTTSFGAYTKRIPAQFVRMDSSRGWACAVVDFYAVAFQDKTFVALCHAEVPDPGKRNMDGSLMEKGEYMVLGQKGLRYVLDSHNILGRSVAAKALGWTGDALEPKYQGAGWIPKQEIPWQIEVKWATKEFMANIAKAMPIVDYQTRTIFEWAKLGEYLSLSREIDVLGEAVTEVPRIDWENDDWFRG